MRLLAGILAVFVCLAAAGVAIAWHSISGIDVPRDGGAVGAERATPHTIYRSVARRAGGDGRRAGVHYGCMELAAGRRYHCVVPGADAGDRRYRVTVDRDSCWTARRAGEGPAHGCLRTAGELD
jgi:hypothetical protein